MAAVQKRLAARILKCSPHRIRFDPEKLEQIEGAITKHDVRGLISSNAIHRMPKNCGSRARARFRHLQRRKGRQTGMGKRKGTKNARQSSKRAWMDKIRLQRSLISQLKENKTITPRLCRMLLLKAKGGFFRSQRHLKLYLNEQLKK